jgi:hypothetical protein
LVRGRFVMPPILKKIFASQPDFFAASKLCFQDTGKHHFTSPDSEVK